MVVSPFECLLVARNGHSTHDAEKSVYSQKRTFASSPGSARSAWPGWSWRGPPSLWPRCRARLDPTGQRPRLILVTCYPFDALVPGGPLRYLVFAEEADGALPRLASSAP